MAYTNSNQIGEITEVTGVAKIIRTDGTEETVTLGTEIFQGDIVETADGGAVNIGFIDDSSFAVSNDARISIDEFVFDPETEGGVQDFSVMKGVFMYTSGLIGRENPDQVEIDTPVGSIGIRGTIIGGDINPDGESSVSVLEGAIVVHNDGGEQLLTNQYETVTLTSRDVAPSDAQQLDAKSIADKFETVKDVSPSLFSSLNDQIAQDQTESNDNTPAEAEAVENSAEQKEEAKADEEAANQEEILDAKAEEDVKEQKSTDEIERTLEETIEKIESLTPDIQLKIHEIHEETGKDLDHILEKKLHLKEKLIERFGDDDLVHQVEFISNLEFSVSLNGDLREANNGNSFTTSGPISIGFITLQENSNALYEIFDDPTGSFTIDSATGELFFEGSHDLDFENSDFFKLGVKAIEQETGRTLVKEVHIDVANVDEAPTVQLALEDVYLVGDLNDASDDKGIVGRDVAGFRIAKLSVTDPEGDTYDASDFSLLGNIGGLPAGEHLQVINDNGELYLELKPGISINGATGKLNDGTTDIGLPLGTDFTIGLSVDGTDQTISLRSGEVESITGTNEVTLANNDDIVIGDDADNNIRLSDDNFLFINGGDGHDTLILEGDPIEDNIYNLSTGTHKDELSSIEVINFADDNGSLEITLDNLIRLLKTSNSTVDGKGELVISTDATGNTISIFEDRNGAATDLSDNGFNRTGQEDRDGEIFDVYTHDTHGTIAIEATISNAGGL